MTEPDTPGSDPTQLRTRAVRDGEEWVIDGHKWFSSNGSIADFLIVMAVTDPDARPSQRASMFIVPSDTPGVEILRDVPTMEHPWEQFGGYGGHAEIATTPRGSRADALLGGEGEGFVLAQQRLGPGRIHHCMRWLGVARRAFDMMCERATYRHAHGSVLADKQTVQNWIADSAAEMQAARLMTLHAAWVMDTEGARAARTDISLIKFYGAKVLHDVVDRALQVHGALGYSTDLPLEQMYRFARGARFYDGPDEVHRQAVARQILHRLPAARRRDPERTPAQPSRAGARALRVPSRRADRKRLARAQPHGGSTWRCGSARLVEVPLDPAAARRGRRRRARGTSRAGSARRARRARRSRSGPKASGSTSSASSPAAGDARACDQAVGREQLGGGDAVELDAAAVGRLDVADTERRRVGEAQLTACRRVPSSRRHGAPHPVHRPPVARAPGVVALAEPRRERDHLLARRGSCR